ncbi:hypothetical protein [Bacillus thuringiensis]|uniref:hypothetical protein n=1 Tax=Bacillus thuringiensis TaxID=1428 RepID=UPI0011A0992A|nr:hypothetical protein [Bacillus thuringiensis]
MIFEAKKNAIRKAYSLIEKMLTSKESKDDEFSVFTMIAENGKVVFVGESEDFPIMTFVDKAKVIVEGRVTVSLSEITNTFKESYRKDVLLTIESQENVVKIDDGFYDPNDIRVINEYEKDIFLISNKHLFSMDREVFFNSLYECAVAVKNTYLTGTSYLQVNVSDEVEFYSTSLHQIIRKTVSADIHSQSVFYIEKERLARMVRLVKEDKSKEILCFIDENEVHIVSSVMQFKVPIEKNISFPRVKEVMESIVSKDVYGMCKKDVMTRMKEIDSYYKEKGIKDTKDTVLFLTLNEPFEIVPDVDKEMVTESDGCDEENVEKVEHTELDSETPSIMQLTEEKVNALISGNIGIFHSEELVFVRNCINTKYGLFKNIIKGIKEESLTIYNTDSIGCVKEPLIIEYKHEQNGHYQSLIMPLVKR